MQPDYDPLATWTPRTAQFGARLKESLPPSSTGAERTDAVRFFYMPLVFLVVGLLWWASTCSNPAKHGVGCIVYPEDQVCR